jgi:dTDP-4-amino-4,6-dideoxygalactose transaminase
MNNIRLMRPYISYDEVEAEFRDVFRTGIFTRGNHVDAFRRELAQFTGARHVHLTTSATTALWTCLRLLGIGSGDEVVVSDFSFPATANVVEDLGATPVFADVSLETYNMEAATLASLLGPRTKAVIFVDALGNPSGLRDISSLCRRRGIPLIEDAACAIGSSEGGARCGSVADLTCFSFHPRKLVSTGEGGAITTDRDDWAQWLDIKLAHGARGMKGMALDFVDYGYNFRLPELPAIMGRKQLAKIDSIVAERNLVRDAYRALLEPLGFEAQKTGVDVRFNVQSLVFSVPPGCKRDSLIAGLKARGVESTIGTYALSATTYFATKYSVKNPRSAWLEANTISLPCYGGVDVRVVCRAIQESFAS